MASRNLIRTVDTQLAGVGIAIGHGLVAMVLSLLLTGSALNGYGLIGFTIGTLLVFRAGQIKVPTKYHGVVRHLGHPQEDKLLEDGHHWIYPFPWARSVELLNR